jgi:hypothetical protein
MMYMIPRLRRLLPAVCVSLILAAKGMVQAEDHATQILLATVKLQHSASAGTGFLIVPKTGVDRTKGECLLVSAAHVFEPCPEDSITVALRVPQPDGNYQRRDVSVPIRRDNREKRPLWVRHPQYDVAVLRMQLPEGVEATPLPVEVLAEGPELKQRRVRIGARLLVFGYPARVEGNPAGFPLARHASLASYPVVPPTAFPVITLDMSAHGGDSGGPVMLETVESRNEDAGPPVILAMVVGKIQQDEKVVGLYEERIMHHPLDLSIAVQAQFIKATVSLWEQVAASPAPR